MLRGTVAFVAIVLVLAVGLVMYRDTSERSNVDKARVAAEQVGGEVVDQGVGGLVKVRLGKELGIDAARFLHVHQDRGDTLIYGLLPDSIDAERVRAVAAEVPGVKSIEVRVMPRERVPDPVSEAPADPGQVPIEAAPQPDGAAEEADGGR
jgi:hypothetical protein